MVEACNTSFQAHFQVGPGGARRALQPTQAVAGPVLAASCNSPLLFGRRFWRETRIALQQSVDHRAAGLPTCASSRRASPSAGDGSTTRCSRSSARHRALLSSCPPTSTKTLATLRRNEVPSSRHWWLHNGTIYRWTWPRYGISEGRPHLRIENRILPSGPEHRRRGRQRGLLVRTYSGLSRVLSGHPQGDGVPTPPTRTSPPPRGSGCAPSSAGPGTSTSPPTSSSRRSFAGGSRRTEDEGHRRRDADRYLGIIEERVRTKKTGAQWQLDSFNSAQDRQPGRAPGAINGAIIANQTTGLPVAQWPPRQPREHAGDGRSTSGQIEQFMTTDIITTHADEAVELVANPMQRKKIPRAGRGQRAPADRHHPAQQHRAPGRRNEPCELGKGPIAVRARSCRPTRHGDPGDVDAGRHRPMRKHAIGPPAGACDGRLVGIVTEHDFLIIAGQLWRPSCARPSGRGCEAREQLPRVAPAGWPVSTRDARARRSASPETQLEIERHQRLPDIGPPRARARASVS